MSGRINFDKRTESEKYLIRINDLEDFEGHLTEFVYDSSYRTEITGSVNYAGADPVNINLLRIFDAESGREVAHRSLPYKIWMQIGDSLRVTFITTVEDNTHGEISISS